ncbi:MAG: TetR/AcrR family transcriptional regulator [Bacteroidia bacterium]|nr:TetR/AcrR family transcriptional regulator [Bacteroidia bacterium]
MELELKVRMNDKLFVRDPESTELGRRIVRQGLLLIQEIGFEQFTFKKLATIIKTTEAGIYRYFENKHKLLVYLVDWYWTVLRYQIRVRLNNLDNAEKKLKLVIQLLVDWGTEPLMEDPIQRGLYHIAISEGNKTYLTKDVGLDNGNQFFKPYKDLCKDISEIMLELKPNFPFALSLSSTLVETSHLQNYFMENLPSLTDFGKQSDKTPLIRYLEHLVFSALLN